MATPLDEERERLREAGYTDDEISRYFVERLRGEGQPSSFGGGVAPQGMMGGVLGNANAALGHVRAAIPLVAGAAENLSNTAAPPKQRIRSAGVLVGVVVVVAVLAFAIWQEWQQHIIYETKIKELNAEIARINVALTTAQNQKAQAEAEVAKEVAAGHVAQAEKAKADAEVARQVAAGQVAQAEKAKADAEVAKQVAAGQAAQAEKAKAEAEVAKQVAAGQVAQAEKAKAEAEVAKQVAAGQVAQAEKAKAEAEVAKQVAAGQVAQAEKAKAEAAVAPEVAAGQAAEARKKQAEAKYAEELAAGQKAQACSARMEMITKTLSIPDMFDAMEQYNRDCNPKYEGCDEDFKDLIANIKNTLDTKEPLSTHIKLNEDKLSAYKKKCGWHEKERDAAIEAYRSIGVNFPAPTPTPVASPSPEASALARPEPTPAPSYSARTTSLSPKAPTIYENYDFDGNDLDHIASDNIEACLSACRGNSQCQGVTFDKWNKVCFLKSQATTLWLDPHGVAVPIDPDARPVHSDAPAYMTRYPGKGFHRTGEMSYAVNSAACERACKQTDWCVAESFFRSDSLCMMLRTTDAYVSNGDAESSIKRQKKYDKKTIGTLLDFLRQ